MEHQDELVNSIRQSDLRANRNTIRCLLYTFVVYFICWVLNVAHIFIVDSSIMNRGLLVMIIFLVIILACTKALGLEEPSTKYIIMFLSITMWSFLNMILTYHALLIIIFPLICSLQYHNKRIVIYTYIGTLIGIAAATLLGFRYGLCDANMLILTVGTRAQQIEIMKAGTYPLNDDLFSVFLYYVVPRWMLITGFVSMLDSLVKDTENRVLQEAIAKRRATVDDMTRVFNRNKYLAMMSDYYPNVEQVSVIFWDVNHLKQINDKYGHEIGDQLIVAVSESIMKFRSETRKIYRIGGDEFVLLAENMQDGEVQKLIADWKKSIDGKTIGDGIPVSAAVGYAEGTGAEVEQTVKQADEDMYRNKKAER